MTISAATVKGRVERFIAWFNAFGEDSLDHQSYYAGPVGGRAKGLYYKHPRIGAIAVAPMVFSEALLPAARRLFHHRMRLPIADAHYAMGFGLLAEVYPGSNYALRREHFLNVLIETRCHGYRDTAGDIPSIG